MLTLGRAQRSVHQAFSRLLSTSACRMDKVRMAHWFEDPENPEDQCILVDKNDKAIGKESKTACHKVSPDGNLLLHRAFSVFLFNSKGDLLLQKRASGKVTYPDHYTNTCCSHPLSTIPKETIEEDALGIRNAAQRRLHFELGVPPEQVKPEDMVWLTRIHYMDRGDGKFGEHEIDYILFLQKDVDVNPEPSEVSEVKYVKRKELNSFLSSLNDPVTPWFDLIAKNQLPTWWDNLNQLHKFYEHNTIHRYV